MNILKDIKGDNVLKRLDRLKQQHAIHELYIFGSATTNEFDPERSDLDFYVVFEENKIPLLSYADNFFGLIDSLKRLFKREIDLITPRSLKNPYFIQNLNRTKVRVL